jgi:hypothetical protein
VGEFGGHEDTLGGAREAGEIQHSFTFCSSTCLSLSSR